jgi:WD40-like Beta Propeller Repeat
MQNSNGSYFRSRRAERVVTFGSFVVILLIIPLAWSNESVRSELIRVQKQTGLSLVSIRDNKIYAIDFAKHSLGSSRALSGRGTAARGTFTQDGTKIAVNPCREPGFTHPTPYETRCPAGVVLAIIRTDGGDSREYPELGTPEYVGCWSHDASKLVVVAHQKLQILDLATGATQVIADYNYNAFVDPQCWSPDDKEVVYTANNTIGTQKVAVYDVEKKTSRDFSKGTRPTWSPDGNWIALMDCPPSLYGCKYFAIRPSGSERKLLFKSEAATALWWSPDSRYVAYVNAAGLFERTPSEQFREVVRLRVRRLEDNSVASFADFFDGDTMDFQWVKSNKIEKASSQPTTSY